MSKTNSVDVLHRFNRSDSLSDILAAVRQDGGVIIRKFVDLTQVEQVNNELAPFVEARESGFRKFAPQGFYGSNTKRLQGLAAKSRGFVDHLLLNDLLLEIADGILLPNCGHYWMSQAETIFIGPGSDAQVLHRDDLNWSVAARLGIDLQLSALIAVGDYDAEVGATLVIPGIQRHQESNFNVGAAYPIELEVGDALIYTGSLVHGGGANVTEDRWRRAIYIGLLVGWLTPEEAVPMSVSVELAKTLPERARELLGWANIRGNSETDGLAAQFQLWQLDHDASVRFAQTFIERD